VTKWGEKGFCKKITWGEIQYLVANSDASGCNNGGINDIREQDYDQNATDSQCHECSNHRWKKKPHKDLRLEIEF
jgi:hypothetical protein